MLYTHQVEQAKNVSDQAQQITEQAWKIADETWLTADNAKGTKQEQKAWKDHVLANAIAQALQAYAEAVEKAYDELRQAIPYNLRVRVEGI